MAWLEILPRYESLFRKVGWESATAFLDWTGVLVNKHRHREVEHVQLESVADDSGSGRDFFLKKEHAVSWRDRFRNAWHGFGWCSTAVREAALLQALREAGIGCPEVAALGEDRRHAFVLLRDHSEMTELRTFLQRSSEEEQHRLATALGRQLARMHAAGFNHPDLFAKHILVSWEGEAHRFCILDWQRGRRRRVVSWRLRRRDLAVLDATLHDGLASDATRMRCLRAYALATADCPPIRRLARQIRAMAKRLREERNIRDVGQMPVPAADQQFVQACAGRLLVVRSYYEQCGGQLPDWLTKAVEPDATAADASIAWALRSDNLSLQTWPRSGSSWDIPLRAHLLFRLQRFGVPAPHLRAVGYRAGNVFLLTESFATIAFEEAFAKATSAVRAKMLHQAGSVVRQIHEAGYYLPPDDSWARRLGVDRATGAISLAKVEPLLRDSAPWAERAPTDLNGQRIRLTRTEQLRFLHGYLRQGHKKVARARQVDA